MKLYKLTINVSLVNSIITCNSHAQDKCLIESRYLLWIIISGYKLNRTKWDVIGAWDMEKAVIEY